MSDARLGPASGIDRATSYDVRDTSTMNFHNTGGRAMNVKTIIRHSVLACAVTLLCAAPSWAIPVNLILQNGGFPGFNATFLHENHLAGGRLLRVSSL